MCCLVFLRDFCFRCSNLISFLFSNSTCLFFACFETVLLLSELLLPPVASPPHRSSPPSASIYRQRIFPNLGPSSIWDRTRGTRSGCPKVRSIAHRSGRIVALENAFARLVHVACVGSCMYVHTNIHTYIYVYFYI